MSDELKLKVPALAKMTSDKVYAFIVMAFMVFLPVAEIITEIMTKNKIKVFGPRPPYPSYFQPYIVGVFGGVLALVIILTFISRIVNGFKFYVADVFFFTLLGFMLLSMFCSVNFGVFAGGSKFYCERPEIFLCYYCLYFAGTMIEDSALRKKLFFTYFAVALIQGVFAFLQTYKIELAYCLYFSNRVSSRAAYGLLQNTNFYGTLSCLFTAILSGLFIFSSKLFKSKALKWITYVAALFVFYTMIGSCARLAWLGFAGMNAAYVISLIIMRKSTMDKESLKKITIDYIIMLAGYIVIIALAVLFTNFITGRIKATVNDTLSKNVSDKDFGHGRGKIWKTEIECIKRHWVTGIGLDNLAQAFREMPGWKRGDYVQDKGHNEYLHLAATQGIFALINYLSLIIYAVSTAVKRIFKEKDDVKRCILWICVTSVAAYLCQAMLSSSIMNVAPYFWIILGLTTPRTKPISFKKG